MMTMRRFTLRYGKGDVSCDLPTEMVIQEIVGQDRPALADVPGAYRHALDHPIDSPPLGEMLRPGYKVAVVVSDITRTWQKSSDTLPVLLDYINQAGVRDEDVVVIVAVGNHRQNTPAEFVEICSAEVCRRVRVVNHQAWDEANLVYYGKTSRDTEVWINRLAAEADRVILTGGAVYHYMCGYGGGRKSVLPGVAGLRTIQQNHILAVSPEVGGGTNPKCYSRRTQDSPMHEDMMEIAAFLQPDFLVNVVTNFSDGIVGVFAGNWITAWQAGCGLVDEMCGVPIDRRADIVIASAGGYPKDINLYQTQKTLDNACYALKPGGVAVILAECPDIREPKEFFDFCAYPDALSIEMSLRQKFVLPGFVALKQTELGTRYQVVLVTRPENFEPARIAKTNPVATLDDGIKLAFQLSGQARPDIIVMPFAANTCPIHPDRF